MVGQVAAFRMASVPSAGLQFHKRGSSLHRMDEDFVSSTDKIQQRCCVKNKRCSQPASRPSRDDLISHHSPLKWVSPPSLYLKKKKLREITLGAIV